MLFSGLLVFAKITSLCIYWLLDPIQFTTELFVVLLDSVDFGCHLIVEVVELLVEILQQVHKVSLSAWSPSTRILFYLLILGF